MIILLLYATPDTLHFQIRKGRIMAAGKYGRLGTPGAFFEIQRAGEEPYSESTGRIDHRAALRRLVDYLQRNRHILSIDDIIAVVHRIPRGGRAFGASVRLDHGAASRLDGILRAHPASLTVRAALHQLPNARHIGIVATGIYRDVPEEHCAPAVHPDLRRAFGAGEDGIWHEAAYQEALALLKARRAPRAVSVHISDRVTVTALLAGRAIASSASMGLRSAGMVDPETMLAVAERLDTETWRVAELLSERSGLAAMTGKDGYAQIEVGARAGDARCVEALAIFAYRIAFVVAGMTAAIGAPELIVFSGDGASWTIIEEVCRRLPGVRLRKRRPGVLSAPRSPAVVWVDQSLDEALLRLARPHLPARAGRRRSGSRNNI